MLIHKHKQKTRAVPEKFLFLKLKSGIAYAYKTRHHDILFFGVILIICIIVLVH